MFWSIVSLEVDIFDQQKGDFDELPEVPKENEDMEN